MVAYFFLGCGQSWHCRYEKDQEAPEENWSKEKENRIFTASTQSKEKQTHFTQRLGYGSVKSSVKEHDCIWPS